MGLGDVVNDVVTSSGTFQPASGVEICITQIGQTAANDAYYVTDGTDKSYILNASQQTGVYVCRLYINNTNYLEFEVGTNDACYTGVQVG